MQVFRAPFCALCLCVFLVACGSDSDSSSSSAPSFAALAGAYSPVVAEEAEAAQATRISASAEEPDESPYDEIPYGVHGAFIDEAGYLQISLWLPGEQYPDISYPLGPPPVYVTVMGYVDAWEDPGFGPRRLVGSLNQLVDNRFVVVPPEEQQPEFAEVDLYAYPDRSVAGMLTLADGSEHVVELEWAAALKQQAGLQAMQGSWAGLYSYWEPDDCRLSVEFDDAGNGFGSLNDVCAVDINVRPLSKGDIYSLDANTDERTDVGDAFLMQADMSVSGCQEAAEYAGQLTLQKRTESSLIYSPWPKLVRLRVGNDERMLECMLQPTDSNLVGRLEEFQQIGPADEDAVPPYEKQVVSIFR